MQVELRKLQQQLGITTIVVTHDQGMGARARRQLVMEDGRLKSDSQQTPISNLAEISG